MIESLERRQLLAGNFNAGVALPYQLDFNRSVAGVLDKDGTGTGFTWVQPNRDGTELDTSRMDLRIGAGVLRLNSLGTNYNADNTLVNALTVRYSASSKPWVISGRINGPIPQIDVDGEQGGIIFGPDQDHYVKLVAIKTGSGQGLQFLDEQKTKKSYRHTLPQNITAIGSFSSIQSLDLFMSGDPATGIVRALYRINGGVVIELPNQLTLTDQKGAFFSSAAFAGVMASHVGSAGIDVTFDQFSLKRGVLHGEVVAGTPTIVSRRIFNDVRGGAGQTVGTSIRNTGNGPLTINSLSITGADASQFDVDSTRTLPVTLAPDESLSLKITFSAASSTSLGIKTATLTVVTSTKTKTVALRGLATKGTGGENEPSLQRILDLYQIPDTVGDTNPDDVFLDDPPHTPNDEVPLQQLKKAGNGPVTITPLAVFGVTSTPGVRFGFYEPGSPTGLHEVFNVASGDVQSVNPAPIGSTSFDPGSGAFALYSIWPGFKNTDDSVRIIYSEDSLNTFDTNVKRHIRFYPMKNTDGSVVPNSFVMAHEEFNGGYDVQDLVGVISNVTTAGVSGAEIGTENLDGAPAPDRLVFNRFVSPDPAHTNTTFHDSAKVRVRNSGTSTLAISSLEVSGPFQILSSTGAQTIAPNKFADVLVKFTGGGSTTGVKTGALTIHSSDSDEPDKVITLAGYNQKIPEGNNEAPLATMLNGVFGFGTHFLNAGQQMDGGGKVAAVGEEILSPYWFRVNSNFPVTVKQITAFHTQGNIAKLAWFAKSNSGTQPEIFTSSGVDAQTLFPRKTNGSAAAGSFTPGSGAFGFRIDAEWSDDKKNPQEKSGGGYGHHVRFFPLRDASGRLVPDTYLMVMDYNGVNYDYNDNVYIISNIRPETGTAPIV